MKRIHLEEDVPVALPQYWLTYSDMMTQLLAFFVVLVSISAMRSEKFQQMMSGVRHAFGVETSMDGTSGNVRAASVWQNMEAYYAPRGNGNSSGGAEVMNVHGREFLCKTVREGKMITMGIRSEFREGGAELTSEARQDLDAVAALVKDYPNRVMLCGHVSAKEEADEAQSWQLSFQRAKAAGDYLEQKGINPLRLRLSACGSVDPVESNLTPEGRARNRRVEIVISEELVQNVVPRRAAHE